MNPTDVIPEYAIGSKISCAFGDGHIVDIRESDGIYIVQLENWKLATNVSPILYLNQASVHPRNHIAETAPAVSLAETCLKNCISAKDLAKSYFQKSDFANAKENYIIALTALRFLDDNQKLSNEEKARFIQQTIPCHNNTAICCLKLKEYRECFMYANNSFNLVTALEERLQNSEVWKALQLEGVDADQLLEWKKKSLFYMGKSMFLLGELDESKTALEMAIKITPANDKSLIELEDMLKKVKEKLAEQLKKQKSTWGKAFKKNATEGKDEGEGSSTPSSPTGKSTPSPTSPVNTSETTSSATGGKKKKKKVIKKKVSDEDENEGDNENNQVSNFSFSSSTLGIFLLGLAGVGCAAFYFLRNRRIR